MAAVRRMAEESSHLLVESAVRSTYMDQPLEIDGNHEIYGRR
jgi:hypothetical protein